ncbi:efflux RND transporter periplasmic adaptor subunit [Thermodesulfobacteriota bacterium]
MSTTSLTDLRDISREDGKGVESKAVERPPFRWTTRVLLPVGLLAGLAGLLLVTGYRELIPAVEVQASPVVLKTVEGAMKGTVTVQAAGWVEADPYKSYVSALEDGVVKEILVLEGETVEKDQVVARLVDEDARLAVELAQAEVGEHEAALLTAEADLTAAETEWENPVERRRAVDVAKAELEESMARLKQVVAEITESEAQAERAKSDYLRAVSLHGSTSISESELVRLRSEFKAKKANVEATTKLHSRILAVIHKNEAELHAAKETMRLRSQEKQRLDRARAGVEKAKALLKQARASLSRTELRLERMEIRSPRDGVVMERLTEPGAKMVLKSDAPHSAHVLSVYDPKRLQVRVDVPLADAAKVGVGQPSDIVVEVLPDRVFSGKVTRVLHEADIQKNTLQVKVAVSEPDPALRPEMLARVKFLGKAKTDGQKRRQSLFAPKASIRRENGAVTSWVVKEFDGTHGIAAERTLELGGAKTEGWNSVQDGLQPGDLVITRSSKRLADGSRVRVVGD